MNFLDKLKVRDDQVVSLSADDLVPHIGTDGPLVGRLVDTGHEGNWVVHGRLRGKGPRFEVVFKESDVQECDMDNNISVRGPTVFIHKKPDTMPWVDEGKSVAEWMDS